MQNFVNPISRTSYGQVNVFPIKIIDLSMLLGLMYKCEVCGCVQLFKDMGNRKIFLFCNRLLFIGYNDVYNVSEYFLHSVGCLCIVVW